MPPSNPNPKRIGLRAAPPHLPLQVAGGASRASLTQHFAIQQNMGDVSAKVTLHLSLYLSLSLSLEQPCLLCAAGGVRRVKMAEVPIPARPLTRPEILVPVPSCLNTGEYRLRFLGFSPPTIPTPPTPAFVAG